MSKERDQFVALLARKCPHLSLYSVATLAGDLIRVGKSQCRISTNLCNIPDYQETYDKTKSRHEKRLRKIAENAGLSPIRFNLGGDPRGCTLKIVFDPPINNTWGDDGYAVPGS